MKDKNRLKITNKSGKGPKKEMTREELKTDKQTESSKKEWKMERSDLKEVWNKIRPKTWATWLKKRFPQLEHLDKKRLVTFGHESRFCNN